MLALVLGLLLAFGQCLTIGPVSAEALRRGLRGGFRAALAVELGSCLGDGLWAALAFLGLGALFTLQFMDLVGTALGVVLLGYLAVESWPRAAVVEAELGQLVAEPSRLPAFWAGLLLSVVNPGSAVFWIGVGATVLSSHLPVVGPLSLLQFAAGYYLALLIWSFGFAAMSWQARRRLPVPAQLWIQRGVALLLGGLAAFSVWNAARHGISF